MTAISRRRGGLTHPNSCPPRGARGHGGPETLRPAPSLPFSREGGRDRQKGPETLASGSLLTFSRKAGEGIGKKARRPCVGLPPGRLWGRVGVGGPDESGNSVTPGGAGGPGPGRRLDSSGAARPARMVGVERRWSRAGGSWVMIVGVPERGEVGRVSGRDAPRRRRGIDGGRPYRPDRRGGGAGQRDPGRPVRLGGRDHDPRRGDDLGAGRPGGQGQGAPGVGVAPHAGRPGRSSPTSTSPPTRS